MKKIIMRIINDIYRLKTWKFASSADTERQIVMTSNCIG